MATEVFLLWLGDIFVNQNDRRADAKESSAEHDVTVSGLFPADRDKSHGRWFSASMKASHRINMRAAILFVAFTVFVLWLRSSPRGTTHGYHYRNSDALMILSICDIYRINNGFYPTTEQGLLAFVKEPHTKPLPGKWTALADHVPLDPWGVEYRYECDDPYSQDRKSIRIISAGKDGTFATEDDLILPMATPPLTWRERISLWLR